MLTRECEIARDLLPLYADGVCSPSSADWVDGHLKSCPECREILQNMRCETPVETLRAEKEHVISRQAKRFRRRSSAAGLTLAAILSPLLVCFIVNLAARHTLDWFFIVLFSLCVVASLCVVPLLTPSHKGLWTLASFAISLTLLLGAVALYAGGDWFPIAALATLAGLSVFCLPFALRGKKVVALALDTVLIAALLIVVGLRVRSALYDRLALCLGVPAGAFVWLLYLLPKGKWYKAGLCAALLGAMAFFGNTVVGALIRSPVPLPRLDPPNWSGSAAGENIQWICLGIGLLLCVLGFVIQGMKRKKGVK